MNVPRQTYIHRIEQIPDPVRLLAYDNPIVCQILEAYGHGEIITKEEALCRMIVELANHSGNNTKDLLDKLSKTSFFQSKPKV